MTRLSQATLERVDGVRTPKFDRASLQSGTLHIGLGAFHRAHQALYTESALTDGDLRWGTIGASLRSARTRDALARQDYLYTVCERQTNTAELQVIGGFTDVLCATDPADYGRLVAAIADPAIHVVTLTITEKGYCQTPGGTLDDTHPDVRHDLERPKRLRSAPGIIAAGLIARRQRGVPLTILSCDNLTANGPVTRSVVTAMVEASNPAAAAWVEDHVTFPSTMVDRIVPRTMPEDIDRVHEEFGYKDAALVVCEPFRQWVIEDQFPGPRPAWEAAGAELVSDVAPYERAKLRIVNATHSMLAYLGLLLGYDFIFEAVVDPGISTFVRGVLRDEVLPSIDTPAGLDAAGYVEATLGRFANAAVPYRTAQVATDGSHKLPQRIYPTLHARWGQHLPTPGLELVICAWLQCLAGRAEDGSAFTIEDSGAGTLRDLVAAYDDPASLIGAIGRETAHWNSLKGQGHEELLGRLSTGLATLRGRGIRPCMADLAQTANRR